ncbi:MAG: tetratricopeptide repeat protein [Cyclobacteriaceae bacterium]|jgi:tetratricopeptide (TPR) repeat protein|nr:tetratricopeptide repeat protein [Cyclobacteriaceae bacterium]
MQRNRIILIVLSAAFIIILYQLPKVVVNNEQESVLPDSAMVSPADPHEGPTATVQTSINRMRKGFSKTSSGEKNAIFADSLADLYAAAGRFDSAAWFAESAAAFFGTEGSWMKAGNSYYQAFTFAMDPVKQNELAEKARDFFGRVLQRNPSNLEAKTNMAMTYLASSNPMQGITLLREVLAQDPRNEGALFNLGMLSIQSGQYDRAIERLNELVAVNPAHVQAQLLLGVAYMNKGDKKSARLQFEKVKELDKDPAVQATADSYLKDLR